MAKTTENWEKNKHELINAAVTAGIDPGIMARISGFESGFKVDARPIHRRSERNRVQQFDGVMAMSTGYGYGQFLDGTWKEMINKYGENYGLENASTMTREQTNAAEIRASSFFQAAMLAEFTRENIEKGTALGGPDANANVYAFHNLGNGDARKFLQALVANPAHRVDSVLSARVILGNPGLYGDGSRTIEESYAAMARHMREYDSYAIEALELVTGFKGIPHRLSQTRPLQLEDRGYDVIALQKSLARLGVNAADGDILMADGDFGARTHGAVQAFQRKYGIPVTGIVDVQTLTAVQVGIRAIESVQDIEKLGGQFRSEPMNVRTDWLQTDAQGLPNYLHARITPTPSATAQVTAPPRPTNPPPTAPTLHPDLPPDVVRTLQTQLNVLHVTDAKHRSLEVDGDYGVNTRAAVSKFQEQQGLPPTGIADEMTRVAVNAHAIVAELQRKKMEREPQIDLRAQPASSFDRPFNTYPSGRFNTEPSHSAAEPVRHRTSDMPDYTAPGQTPFAPPARPPVPMAPRSSYDDPRHPDHALFDVIRKQLPSGTSDDMAAHATLEAKKGGIVRPDQIRGMAVEDGRLTVMGKTGLDFAVVELTASAPPLQETLEHSAAFDRQQAIQLAQFREQQQQLNMGRGGPSMTL